MDVERETLVTLFKNFSYAKIIKILMNTSSEKQCIHELRSAFLDALPQVAPNRTKEEYRCYADRVLPCMNNDLDLFGELFSFSNTVLTYGKNSLYCRKEDMLRWREVTHQLGQDLFVIAHYAAHNNLDYAARANAFAWGPTLRSDDYELYKILDKGMAENHYHLNGSTQVFPLAWCCLMNHIAGRAKEVRLLDAYLSPKTSYEMYPDGRYKLSFYGQCITAAALRVDLYRLNNYISKSTEGIPWDTIKGTGWWREMTGRGNTLHPELITGRLQRDIEMLKQLSRPVKTQLRTYFLDYMIDQSVHTDIMDSPFRALVGERRFLFFCLHNIYSHRYSVKQQMAFHLYLLLKNSIRDELIQTNAIKGLQNFVSYEQRKEIFIDNYPQYQDEKVQLAVNAPVFHQAIDSLELRLCPKENAKKNQVALKQIEDLMKPTYRDKISYVFHFPRELDTIPTDTQAFYLRHQRLRKVVMQKAVALIAFYNKYPLGERLIAIDACANEIGCPPEIMAPAFRRIRQLSPLMATYHAGESFYDIVDGLRSIDEAMTFCALKRNDRIGHGMVLGVDTGGYYYNKHNSLIMPKQVLLDNIVWLLVKWKSHLHAFSELKSNLEQKANKLIEALYTVSKPDIDTYYIAWQLRGDIPEYYRIRPTSHIPSMAVLNTLLHFPAGGAEYALTPLENGDLRSVSLVWKVVHEYLYSPKTARTGAEPELFKIAKGYKDAISAVQTSVCSNLAQRGIMIESNPSSNLLIGPVDRYANHPIFRIFPVDKENRTNRSLSISVNTDDQGIFDTSLENEYALLACALAKESYDSEEIYAWIDEIREMGYNQTFKKKESKEIVGV